MFVFGGCTVDGTLLSDLWIFDQDSMTWTYATCFGNPPSARKGASLCATEDGRRLYLFGGNDGTRPLNDVLVLELEKLSWAHVPVHVGVWACTVCGWGLERSVSQRWELGRSHVPAQGCRPSLSQECPLWWPQGGGLPEAREGHVACILSKYMLISGGCGQGGTKPLADMQVWTCARCRCSSALHQQAQLNSVKLCCA